MSTPVVPAAPTTPGADDPGPHSTAPRKAMFIVFLVVFIDLLGFGIVLPLLPRYAGHYLPVVPEAWRGAALGVLYSIFSLMQFVVSPVWGRVSDRIGRRPVLMVGLAGSVAFYALFGLASSLPADAAWLALGLLFVSRLGAGVAGASVGTAAAVIADCTTRENRAKGMALIGAAFGIGFTFGPLIGYAGLELFAGQPWAPGAAASALSLVALVLAVRLLPETRPASGGESAGKEWFSLSRTIEVLRTPTVGALALIYFLVIFAFANFEGTLALLTRDALGLPDDRDNFLIFAYVGLVLTLVQGGVYRRLAGKVPVEALLAAGVVMLLVGLAGVAAVAANPLGLGRGGLYAAFFVVTALAVAGFSFVNPSVSALVSRRSDPARQGEVIGVNQSFAALGRILGPFLGLVLFEADPTRVAPYAAAVVLMLVVAGLLPRVRQAA